MRKTTNYITAAIVIIIVALLTGCKSENRVNETITLESTDNPTVATASPDATKQSALPTSSAISDSVDSSELFSSTTTPGSSQSIEIAPTAPAASETPKPSSSSPSNSISPSPSGSDKSVEKKSEIDADFQARFSSIRSSCQEKVSNLTGEVTSYIAGAKSGDGEVSIADLQKKFLGKVAAAEASCDKQFSTTLAQAEQAYKDAGVVDTKLAVWKSEYDNGKAQSRLSAMSKILAAWQAE
ncbi:hypothetical protein ACFSR7_19585 [Cohnella sp. GCM10020058]|uniref:hypothetical protein n=1 Tax=Cohnella sp. GCM10020058 TaxID=3317330 RepID=UPI003639E22D